MGTKQRIGNEATNRARVPVRVCSHFSFSRACPLPDPRFSNFHCHPMSYPHEWPSIAADQGTKIQKIPILAEPGKPGTANLRAKPLLACKAGVFWSAIHELFSGITLSCRSLIALSAWRKERNFYFGWAPSKGFAKFRNGFKVAFFGTRYWARSPWLFGLFGLFPGESYFEMRSGKCGSWKRTGLCKGVKH